MLPSHDVLLHEAYRKAVRKLFRKRRDKELEVRLREELARLRFGPGNNDTVLKGMRTPALRGRSWRRRVGRHRLVYMPSTLSLTPARSRLAAVPGDSHPREAKP